MPSGPYGNAKIAGPAIVVSSVAAVALFVATAYTVPFKSPGIVTWPSVTCTKDLSSPLKKATYMSPEVSVPLAYATLTESPGLPSPRVSVGKALKGSAGLDEGQETMKPLERV